MRVGEVHCDHHALACGKTIGLDDNGRALLVDVGMRLRDIAEGGVRSGGYAVPLHEAFGKIFRAFELRGALRGAEDALPRRAKRIHHAVRKRRFGTDDR